MDQANLEYWRRQIQQDEPFRTVLKSEAFARLKGISFLGAMDYALGSRTLSTGSRAEHSLNVAALANYVATLRGYSEELKKHLILAGLLHDIGHAPLSHSAEPYIKGKLGYGHHQMGLNIIQGKVNIGKCLHQVLSKVADIGFIVALIEQKAPVAEGGDLFSSPINIDTIEGITRTLTLNRHYDANKVDSDRLKYTKASFFIETENATKSLDEFWRYKNIAYTDLVNSVDGLVADELSQRYFWNECSRFDQQQAYSSEKVWRKQFGRMFSLFNEMRVNRTLPQWLSDISIKYTARDYRIDETNQGQGRYTCTRTEKVERIANSLA